MSTVPGCTRRSLRPDARCTVSEMLLFNSNTYCTNQLFVIKSQSSLRMRSHCSAWSLSNNLSAHTIQEETARWLLRQAWLEPVNIRLNTPKEVCLLAAACCLHHFCYPASWNLWKEEALTWTARPVHLTGHRNVACWPAVRYTDNDAQRTGSLVRQQLSIQSPSPKQA